VARVHLMASLFSRCLPPEFTLVCMYIHVHHLPHQQGGRVVNTRNTCTTKV
jgi:hypothetical protein